MKAAVASEFVKITSTRMWWILAAVMVATVAMFVASLGLALVFGEQMAAADGQEVEMDPHHMAVTIYSTGATLGYVFPIVVGALFVTGEFRHRTIDTTLVVQPRRIAVIAAKFIAALPFAVLFGVLTAITSLVAGAASLAVGGADTYLSDSDVWRVLGGSVIGMATWMLVGVGIGTVLTNQVAAIVVLLGFTQFLEPVARLALGMVESLAPLGKYLPGAAGDAIMGASFYEVAGGGGLLSTGTGLAVLLGYAAAFAVAGWLITFRRDIT